MVKPRKRELEAPMTEVPVDDWIQTLLTKPSQLKDLPQSFLDPNCQHC